MFVISTPSTNSDAGNVFDFDFGLNLNSDAIPLSVSLTCGTTTLDHGPPTPSLLPFYSHTLGLLMSPDQSHYFPTSASSGRLDEEVFDPRMRGRESVSDQGIYGINPSLLGGGDVEPSSASPAVPSSFGFVSLLLLSTISI